MNYKKNSVIQKIFDGKNLLQQIFMNIYDYKPFLCLSNLLKNNYFGLLDKRKYVVNSRINFLKIINLICKSANELSKDFLPINLNEKKYSDILKIINSHQKNETCTYCCFPKNLISNVCHCKNHTHIGCLFENIILSKQICENCNYNFKIKYIRGDIFILPHNDIYYDFHKFEYIKCDTIDQKLNYAIQNLCIDRIKEILNFISVNEFKKIANESKIFINKNNIFEIENDPKIFFKSKTMFQSFRREKIKKINQLLFEFQYKK